MKIRKGNKSSEGKERKQEDRSQSFMRKILQSCISIKAIEFFGSGA